MTNKFNKAKNNSLKLFAGVDLHNESFNVHVLDENGKKCHSKKVDTTEADIQEYFEPYKGYEMTVAVEIGNPTFWFCDILEKMGFKVNIVNVYKYCRTSNNKQKNDKRDAKNLAFDLLQKNLPKTAVYKPDLTQRELRTLLCLRHQCVRDNSRLVNRVYSFLSGRGIKVKKGFLTKSLKNWEELFARLNEDKDLEFVRSALRLFHETFKHLQSQILQIEDCIHKHIKKHYQSTYNRLITLPGIGFSNAVCMIALVGDWGRFKSGKAFSAYFGVVPGYRESAGVSLKGDGNMTREGSPIMRGYLIQGVLGLLRSKREEVEPLKTWYQQVKLRRGWKKARVALARKMCEIAFAMIRKGADYDPSFLTKNNQPAL